MESRSDESTNLLNSARSETVKEFNGIKVTKELVIRNPASLEICSLIAEIGTRFSHLGCHKRASNTNSLTLRWLTGHSVHVLRFKANVVSRDLMRA